jgi:hypothetical protein
MCVNNIADENHNYAAECQSHDVNVVAAFYHRFIEASKYAYAGHAQLGDMDYVNNATTVISINIILLSCFFLDCKVSR